MKILAWRRLGKGASLGHTVILEAEEEKVARITISQKEAGGEKGRGENFFDVSFSNVSRISSPSSSSPPPPRLQLDPTATLGRKS